MKSMGPKRFIKGTRNIPSSRRTLAQSGAERFAPQLSPEEREPLVEALERFPREVLYAVQESDPAFRSVPSEALQVPRHLKPVGFAVLLATTEYEMLVDGYNLDLVRQWGFTRREVKQWRDEYQGLGRIPKRVRHKGLPPTKHFKRTV